MRIIVVGAGVVGLAVAEALARGGAEVVVLDRRGPGRGASQASAGVLAPWVEAHHDKPLLGLGTRSLDLFDDFVAGVSSRSGHAIPYDRSGTLEVALGDDEIEPLRAAANRLAGRGVAHEWLDAAALAGAEPALTRTAVAGLLTPAHGWVDVAALMKALATAARLAGARFETPADVTAIEPAPDGVVVRLADRRLEADRVVVAAGSWTRRLGLPGAAAPGVRPVRGQLLHLAGAPSARPRRVVWGRRCYVVPWPDDQVLVGATVEDVGFDERSTVAGVRDLLDAAGDLLPGAWQASVSAIRVGLRPATADGLPLIGPLAGAPAVVLATGHYRNGVLLAPLTAAILAPLILAGEADPALRITDPGRTG